MSLRRRNPSRKHRRRSQPRLESLESRRVLATFFVDTAVDDAAGFCAADNAGGNANCSLRAAVAAAEALQGADTIQIPAGTYLISPAIGSFDLANSQDTAFVGSTGNPADVIIDGQNQSRGFDIFGSIGVRYDVSFENLTIRNGVANDGSGGGGINATSDVDLSLSNVIIENNLADINGGLTSSGGGVFADGNLTITDSTIRDNTATDSGGGVFANGGTVTVTNSNFTGNDATGVDSGGGGLYIDGGNNFSVTDTNFDNNTAVAGAGGLEILNAGGGINGGTFTNNRVIPQPTTPLQIFEQGGGAIAVLRTGAAFTVTISDAYVQANSAPSAGGIAVVDSNVVISDSTIDSNTATNNVAMQGGGGGIGAFNLNDGTSVTIERSRIIGNITAAEAGGIGTVDVPLTITDSFIDDNQATGGRAGGVGSVGITNNPNTAIPLVMIARTTVSNNQSNTAGGGIAVDESQLQLTNVTVTGNSSQNGSGGGIAYNNNDDTNASFVSYSTIASNNALVTGGNLATQGTAALSIDNSIFGDGDCSRAAGSAASAGFNIDSGDTCGFTEPSDRSATNPLLGLLQDNGGPAIGSALAPGGKQITPTMAIGVGSPAIDTADATPPATDAREIVRPQDGDGNAMAVADRGAFEAEPMVVGTLTVSDVFIEEGNPDATVIVTLDNAVGFSFNVDFMTVDGTATQPGDYTTAAGMLTFNGTAGEQRTITVAIADDNVAENDEQFTVTLSGAPASIDASDTGTISIFDEDFAFLTLTDAPETNEDTGSLPVTLTLTGETDAPFTVDITTLDLPGGAVAGVDYTAANGATVTFAGNNGETQTFDVAVTPDAIVEPAEDFAIEVNNINAGTRQITFDDFADRADITRIGQFDPVGIAANDVELFTPDPFTSIAYVADDSGLLVLDVSDPTAIVQLGAFPLANPALAIDVVDVAFFAGVVYVAAGDSGLQILDVSDPSNITRLGSFTTPGQTALSLDREGTTVYLGEGNAVMEGAVRILDVTNPGNITQSGIVQGNLAAVEAVLVDGTTAYIASDLGMEIIDVSNPAIPVTLGSFVAREGTALAAFGPEVYLGTPTGLAVLDVDNPAAITEQGFFATTAEITSVDADDASGPIVSIADVAGNFQALNVLDPMNITVVGAFALDPTADGFDIEGLTAYVATASGGLQILSGDLVATTTGRILNDDTATLSIADNSGNEDGGPIDFTVTLTGQLQAGLGISIDAQTVELPGQATSGIDFTAVPNQTLNFVGNNGETQTLSVNITPDPNVEPDETFAVDLSNLQAPAGVSIALARGIGTILNDDAVCSTIVTTIADSGAGSLREAINCANTTPGANTISFAIPGAGPHTIQPLTPLPPLSDTTGGTTIAGYSQGNAAVNTNPEGQGLNTDLRIVIDGSSLAATSTGFELQSSGNILEGLVIDGFNVHVDITGSGNVVRGNFIGTNVSGTNEGSLIASAGIRVPGSNNRIGGTDPAERNLVSAAGSTGIIINGATATGNLVQGNLVGTDVSGLAPLGNSTGIRVSGGDNNTIGGTTAGAGNVVAANSSDGISVFGSATTNTIVQGNTVGLGVDGLTTLGNGVSGIVVFNGASGTIIGGTDAGAGNLIGDNARDGIALADTDDTTVQGNAIGTDFSGTVDLGNGADPVLSAGGIRILRSNNNLIGGSDPGAGNIIAFNDSRGLYVETFFGPANGNVFAQNRVFDNERNAIDLRGGNNGQEPPVITAADPGTSTIDGTLTSLTDTQFRIEFFVTSDPHPFGFSEGETFLGFQDVTTNAAGAATFSFNSPLAFSVGEVLTATATRLGPAGELVESSEFSNAFAFVADLGITKVESVDPVLPGGMLTYTLDVSNAGPNLATSVTVTDMLPANLTFVSGDVDGMVDLVNEAGGVVTATIGNLAVGATSTVTITTTVADDAVGTINNTATVTSAETDTNDTNNSATAATLVGIDLTDDVFGIDEDEPIASRLVFNVLANDLPSGPLTITSLGGTPTLGTPQITGGGTTITYTPTPDAFGQDMFTYTASNGAGQVATANVTVNIASVNDGPTAGADEFTATDRGPFSITFAQLTVNDSPGPANENQTVVVADVANASANGGDLMQAGQSVTYTPDPAFTGLVDTFTYTASDGIDTATGTVTINLPAPVDLATSINESADPVETGATVTLTIPITNNGGIPATGIVSTTVLPIEFTIISADVVPDGTRVINGNQVVTDIMTLDPGATATLTIVADVGNAAGDFTTNTSVSSDQVDANAADNSAVETTTVILPSSIVGHITCDANGNGVEDPGEEVVGTTVFLDTNGNRILDPLERFTLTDNMGNYSFANVVPPAMDNPITSGSVGPSNNGATITVVAQVPFGCDTIPNAPGIVRSVIGVGDLARSITSVDIDLDGDRDILTASDASGTMSLLVNDGGNFTLADEVFLGSRPHDVVAWESPGMTPTVAVAGIGTPTDGGSIFTLSGTAMTATLGAGNGPIEVALADFDNNGVADVLAAAFRSSDVRLLMNGSSNALAIAAGNLVTTIAVGDVNGDGNDDVVLGTFGYPDDDSSQLSALLGDGAGGFSAPITTEPIPQLVSVKVTQLDSNGAANDHRVFALSASGQLIVYSLVGGSLVEVGSTSITQGASSFDTGDFNRDGITDVAIANLGDQQIDLLIGNGAGQFATFRTITNVPAPSDIVADDFDNDGADDLAVANLYQDANLARQGAPSYQLPSTATILRLDVAENTVVVSASAATQVDFTFQSADPSDVFDVTGEGEVTAMDALRVINYLSRKGEGEQVAAAGVEATDVNRDGKTSAIDALMIINYLNEQAASQTPVAGIDLLADDDDEDDRIAAVDLVLMHALN